MRLVQAELREIAGRLGREARNTQATDGAQQLGDCALVGAAAHRLRQPPFAGRVQPLAAEAFAVPGGGEHDGAIGAVVKHKTVQQAQPPRAQIRDERRGVYAQQRVPARPPRIDQPTISGRRAELRPGEPVAGGIGEDQVEGRVGVQGVALEVGRSVVDELADPAVAHAEDDVADDGRVGGCGYVACNKPDVPESPERERVAGAGECYRRNVLGPERGHRALAQGGRVPAQEVKQLPGHAHDGRLAGVHRVEDLAFALHASAHRDSPFAGRRAERELQVRIIEPELGGARRAVGDEVIRFQLVTGGRIGQFPDLVRARHARRGAGEDPGVTLPDALGREGGPSVPGCRCDKHGGEPVHANLVHKVLAAHVGERDVEGVGGAQVDAADEVLVVAARVDQLAHVDRSADLHGPRPRLRAGGAQ